MLMETKNEKDLRVYVQPETEVFNLNSEGVICGSSEDGDDGGDV